MGIDRKKLKQGARERLAQTRPALQRVTLVYLLFVAVIGIVDTELASIMNAWNAQALAQLEAGRLIGPMSGAASTAWLFSLAFSLISFMLYVGYLGSCLKTSRGARVSASDLMEGFRFFFKGLGIMILMSLIVTAGTILFIVPGVILAISYSQAYFIMLDNPTLSVVTCLKASRILMRGHKAEYLMLVLSFFLWILPASAVSWAFMWIGESFIGGDIWPSVLFYAVYVVAFLPLIPWLEVTLAGYYDALCGGIPARTDIGGDYRRGTDPWDHVK